MKLINRHIKKFEQFIEAAEDPNKKNEKDPRKMNQSEPDTYEEELDEIPEDEDAETEIKSKKEKDMVDEINEYFEKQKKKNKRK